MPYWINDECVDCGVCLGVCPSDAIEEQRPPISDPYLSIINALLTIAQALQALKYNGQVLDLGPMKIIFTGQTISVES
jgi:ferredoxin